MTGRADPARQDTLTRLSPDDTLAVLVHGHHMTRAEAHQLMNRASRANGPESFATAELTAHHDPRGGVRYDVHDLSAVAVDWLMAVRAYGLEVANAMFPAGT